MRKLARESAFKVIYKSLFVKGDLASEEILEDDKITAPSDVEFVTTLVSLYEQNEQEINDKINSKLTAYTPDRVYRIDRAIIALALTEIMYYKQTPLKIVINEAVEMAKKYSTEKSYSFVNGMLKALTEDYNGI